MPKLSRRALLQTAAAASLPAAPRLAGAARLTVAWDRQRAAPGDTVAVIVRGDADAARVTVRSPCGRSRSRTVRLSDGRAELAVELLPGPTAPGVHLWAAEVDGASARLEVIANPFVFGL